MCHSDPDLHPVAGGNALQILREIGVYDDIAKSLPDPSKTNMPGFTCVMGTDLSEEIHVVRFSYVLFGESELISAVQLASEKHVPAVSLLRYLTFISNLEVV